MLTLATVIYSALEPVILRDNGRHNFGDITRRIARVATLDGGSVFDDKGSSITDSEVTLDLSEIDAATYIVLRAMVTGYSTLHLTCLRGSYLVRPVTLSARTLSLYIEEEL